MPGIIRRENMDPSARFSFSDLEAESRRLLAQARDEAERIRAEARATAQAEIAQARAAAEAEGRQAGYDAGHAEALASVTEAANIETRARIESLCKALAGLTETFRGRQHRLLAESERGLLDLTLAVAARVCRSRMHASETAAAAARDLLELVGPRHELVLEFHAEDLERLQQAAPDWLASKQAPAMRAAEDLQPGDCRLLGPDGTIDATIETQLDRIAAALRPDEPPPTRDTA